MYSENTPTIETSRLILRKFRDSDIDDMFLLYSDEEVNKFLPFFPFKTVKEVENYLYNDIFPFYTKDVAYSYAIAQKTDNRVIGYVHINDIGGSNDMGCALRKEFWHKGVTSEACAAIVDRLRKVKFPFITAKYDVKNPYSGEVMKKIGMSYCYSYTEQWQPKNVLTTFRMYQLNLDGVERTYTEYLKNIRISKKR